MSCFSSLKEPVPPWRLPGSLGLPFVGSEGGKLPSPRAIPLVFCSFAASLLRNEQDGCCSSAWSCPVDAEVCLCPYVLPVRWELLAVVHDSLEIEMCLHSHNNTFADCLSLACGHWLVVLCAERNFVGLMSFPAEAVPSLPDVLWSSWSCPMDAEDYLCPCAFLVKLKLLVAVCLLEIETCLHLLNNTYANGLSRVCGHRSVVLSAELDPVELKDPFAEVLLSLPGALWLPWRCPAEAEECLCLCASLVKLMSLATGRGSEIETCLHLFNNTCVDGLSRSYGRWSIARSAEPEVVELKFSPVEAVLSWSSWSLLAEVEDCLCPYAFPLRSKSLVAVHSLEIETCLRLPNNIYADGLSWVCGHWLVPSSELEFVEMKPSPAEAA